MLVLEKISNYLLIVKKLRGLGIDFPCLEMHKEVEKWRLQIFF
jgi:hypothetical protein